MSNPKPKKKRVDLKTIFANIPDKVSLWYWHDRMAEITPAKYKALIKKRYFIEEVKPQLYHPIIIDWCLKDFGFGELVFWQEDGKIYCQNEGMSREIVKKILGVLVDQAVFEEEVKPKKAVRKKKKAA